MRRFKNLSLSLLILMIISTVFIGCGENSSNHNYSELGGNNEEATE